MSALTRRAALAGVAAAAVARSSATAPDPVPELVAEWRRREAHALECNAALCEAQTTLGAWGFNPIGPCVRHGDTLLLTEAQVARAAGNYVSMFTTDTREAAAARGVATWRQQVARWNAAAAKLRIRALEAASDAADREQGDVEDRLRETAATSIGGVLAKLRVVVYLLDIDESLDREIQDAEHRFLLDAIDDLERLAAEGPR